MLGSSVLGWGDVRSGLVTLALLAPFLLVASLSLAWQAGAGWAVWPALAVAIAVGVVAVGAIVVPRQRSKPTGYIGRFRRGDGVEVHVARLGDGRLMVVSNDPQGFAQDLGTVSGL